MNRSREGEARTTRSKNVPYSCGYMSLPLNGLVMPRALTSGRLRRYQKSYLAGIDQHIDYLTTQRDYWMEEHIAMYFANSHQDITCTGGNKGLFVLLSRTQAGPGRTVRQEQEEISRNHVQTFICLPVQLL